MLNILKPSLPVLLSLNGGFVDTAGFLALQGLFTAHVTGNFVTIGGALVFGTSGVITKLLALPTFCGVIIVTRLLSYGLPARGLPVLRTMLVVKVALLTTAAVLAISLGPFKNADEWSGLVTGLVLVSAMAIQNAVHRIHMTSAPPTTLMTGTTTQMMIDAADLLRGLPADKHTVVRSRFLRMAASVIAFAAGCASGALLFKGVSVYCFIVPPIIAASTLLLQITAFEGDVK